MLCYLIPTNGNLLETKEDKEKFINKLVRENKDYIKGLEIRNAFWLRKNKTSIRPKDFLSVVIEIITPEIANAIINFRAVYDYKAKRADLYTNSGKVDYCFRYLGFGYIAILYKNPV